MAEIRDIKPAEPLWPKRQIDRIQPEGEAQQERKKQRRDQGEGEEERGREDPDSPGKSSDDGHIDEYA